MGETFNKIGGIFERRPNYLYNSEGVVVERFEDTKIPRPKSQALKEAYPDLYAFLMKEKEAPKLKVGILHLDGNGAISRKLAHEGKSPIEIALILRKNFISGLRDIAKNIKENPGSELGKIEFFTAFSRFASEGIAKELGFEVFEIDEEDGAKYKSGSHRYTAKTYDILTKKGVAENPDVNKIRPANIALISRQAVFNILENHK